MIATTISAGTPKVRAARSSVAAFSRQNSAPSSTRRELTKFAR
jgi:hypothetical protein